MKKVVVLFPKPLSVDLVFRSDLFGLDGVRQGCKQTTETTHLRKSFSLMSPSLRDVFFHKVQLIIHPAFVKLNSTVFGQNVKYPQVFGAVLFQTMRAAKTEGLC